MTNEAVLRVQYAPAVNFLCGNGTGIEKGAILKMSGSLTAATGGLADNEVFVGIAAEEKIASDGKDSLPVFRHGIFDVRISGTATAGDPIGVCQGTNSFKTYRGINSSLANIAGFVLETAGSSGTYLAELLPFAFAGVSGS